MAIAATVMFVNLGSSRLWDRDEPRNAGCAAEMMQRGDWIVPIFNDELRHQKPVLLYWLIGLAYAVFGVNEFAARFWSALFALGTVACTYLIGRRLFGNTAATMGALALSTSLMFVVSGRAATPDSILIFCQTLALTIYIYGTFAAKQYHAERPKLHIEGDYFPRNIPVTAAMYAAMGVGVLAKGPIGFIMPMAIIGMFVLIETLPVGRQGQLEGYGNWTKGLARIARLFAPKHFLATVLSMNPLLAVAVISAIAAPWFVLVGLRTNGEFIQRFFIYENIARATSTFENHGGGLWYYPLSIVLGFFPWSIFLVPMFLGIDRRLSKSHPSAIAITFLMCWICVQVGIFSLASTKLPSYVTPCYPALALCCGFTLERWTREKDRLPLFWDKAVMATLALTGIGLSLAISKVSKTVLVGNDWLIGLGLIWVVIALVGWFHLAPTSRPRWVLMFQAAAVLFSVGLFGFGTIAVDKTQQANRLIDPLRARGTPIAAYRCLESSWVFYGHQPIYELATDPSKADQSLERVRFWNAKPKLLPAAFATKHPDACFITTDQDWDELRAQLPSNYQVVETVPYFLRNKKLILVAPDGALRVADREQIGQPQK